MADPGNGAERSLLAHILSASAFMDCGGEEEEGEEEGEGEEGEEGEEKWINPLPRTVAKTEHSTTIRLPQRTQPKQPKPPPPSAIRPLETRPSITNRPQRGYPTNRTAPSRLTDPTSKDMANDRPTQSSARRNRTGMSNARHTVRIAPTVSAERRVAKKKKAVG